MKKHIESPIVRWITTNQCKIIIKESEYKSLVGPLFTKLNLIYVKQDTDTPGLFRTLSRG